MIYRTYCKEIPEQLDDITNSFCNKPMGGLWGCRGNEWKNWCKSEHHRLDHLKQVFYWTLADNAKCYRIHTEEDFIKLIKKYGNTKYDSIDYMQMKKDYDAIEVVGNVVYELRYGCKDTGHKFIDMMGLNAWDIPSICVMNTDKVVRLRYAK